MPGLKRTTTQILGLNKPQKKLKRTVSIRQLPSTPSASYTGYGIAGGFPTRSKIVTLKYVQEFNLDPGVGGVPVEQVFRGNSVYDPDYTGAGSQPYGFDQWASIYSAYCVIRARIKVSPSVVSTPSVAGQFGIYISKDSAAAGTGIKDLLEKNTSTARFMCINSNPTPYAKASVDVAKMYSLKDIMDDPNMSASVSGNPTASPFFHVWMAGVNGQNPDLCTFLAELEFDVIFHDPTTIATS